MFLSEQTLLRHPAHTCCVLPPTNAPQAISNSLWSYSKLAYNPGQRLLDTAARRAAGMLHQYTSQEIANTLWAFATLEHNPSSAMLDAAALQIARRIEQFSPQVGLVPPLLPLPLLQGESPYLPPARCSDPHQLAGDTRSPCKSLPPVVP